jgi:hypothetical protein
MEMKKSRQGRDTATHAICTFFFDDVPLSRSSGGFQLGGAGGLVGGGKPG